MAYWVLSPCSALSLLAYLRQTYKNITDLTCAKHSLSNLSVTDFMKSLVCFEKLSWWEASVSWLVLFDSFSWFCSIMGYFRSNRGQAEYCSLKFKVRIVIFIFCWLWFFSSPYRRSSRFWLFEQVPLMPWGLGQVLELFKQVYGNPPVFIYENGLSLCLSLDLLHFFCLSETWFCTCLHADTDCNRRTEHWSTGMPFFLHFQILMLSQRKISNSAFKNIALQNLLHSMNHSQMTLQLVSLISGEHHMVCRDLSREHWWRWSQDLFGIFSEKSKTKFQIKLVWETERKISWKQLPEECPNCFTPLL